MSTTSTLPIKDFVRELNKQFSEAVKHLPKAERGNARYKAECDFAWFINEITAGPACMVYEHVNGCKTFIDNLTKQK